MPVLQPLRESSERNNIVDFGIDEMLYRPNTLWTWILLVSTFIKVVVLIALEAYVLTLTLLGTKPADLWNRVIYTSIRNNATPVAWDISAYRCISTFFVLVTLWVVYQLLLAYDTLAHRSTIQLISLGIYSAALSVYNGIQYGQLRDIVEVLIANAAVRPGSLQGMWPLLQGMMISIIAIPVSFTFLILFSAWKLYEEFAWVTLRTVDADKPMRRRYLYLQASKPFLYAVVDTALTFAHSLATFVFA